MCHVWRDGDLLVVPVKIGVVLKGAKCRICFVDELC